MRDSRNNRHLAKTVTWRLVGTLDTIIIAWLITSDSAAGLNIGLAEMLTKMTLYYFHERLWARIAIREGHKKHVFKALSWRMIGTVDTMLLAWIITGNPMVGFKIGLVEVLSKLVLYYLHERAWYYLTYQEDHAQTLKDFRK